MHNAPNVIDSLTDKQCEALELVLQHMSSKEIAKQLGISPRAVDQRLDAVRSKLGAATRWKAARLYNGTVGPVHLLAPSVPERRPSSRKAALVVSLSSSRMKSATRQTNE